VSGPQPSIGPATIDDVPELARLRWELYAEQNGDPTESFEAYVDRFARFARSALTAKDWRAWVARTDDGLVGAMWLHTVLRVPVPGKRAGPIGYLTNVYIAPEHRNAGLGAQMLDRGKAWCGEEGFSLVIVWPTERSRSFYRRGGFDRPGEPLVLEVEPDGPPEPSTGGEA
jgi:GNAT superfamily N-acetyltransferase